MAVRCSRALQRAVAKPRRRLPLLLLLLHLLPLPLPLPLLFVLQLYRLSPLLVRRMQQKPRHR
jgi:hypothetical protein